MNSAVNNIYTRKIAQWKSNVAAGKVNMTPYNRKAKNRAAANAKLQQALAGNSNAMSGVYRNNVGLRAMMASPGYYGNWNTSRNKNALRTAAGIRRQQATNASAAFKMMNSPAAVQRRAERAAELRRLHAQEAAGKRVQVGNMRHTASKSMARRTRRNRRN